MSSPLDYRRHYQGALLVDDGSATGWTQYADTTQCVHCAKHWVIQPGSGIERGYCMNCRGPVCGGENCWDCKGPIEALLERMEAAGRMEANLKAIRGA